MMEEELPNLTEGKNYANNPVNEQQFNLISLSKNNVNIHETGQNRKHFKKGYSCLLKKSGKVLKELKKLTTEKTQWEQQFSLVELYSQDSSQKQ